MVVFSILIQYFRPPQKIFAQSNFVYCEFPSSSFFVKLIFKIFALENAQQKKGSELDPGFVYSSGRFIQPRQSFLSGTNLLLHRLCQKKKKLTAKKTKRFNLIQKYPFLKIVCRHFEVIIELKKFTISSFKSMKIPSYKYKFKQILKKIGQAKALDLSYVFPRILTLLLFLLERRK